MGFKYRLKAVNLNPDETTDFVLESPTGETVTAKNVHIESIEGFDRQPQSKAMTVVIQCGQLEGPRLEDGNA